MPFRKIRVGSRTASRIWPSCAGSKSTGSDRAIGYVRVMLYSPSAGIGLCHRSTQVSLLTKLPPGLRLSIVSGHARSSYLVGGISRKQFILSANTKSGLRSFSCSTLSLYVERIEACKYNPNGCLKGKGNHGRSCHRRGRILHCLAIRISHYRRKTRASAVRPQFARLTLPWGATSGIVSATLKMHVGS